MLAQREPVIKMNENYPKTHACSVCGFEISDEFCSKSDKNLCSECGGDICFNNKKHSVVNGFCLKCGTLVKHQIEYQRWINNKLPFCDVKVQNV